MEDNKTTIICSHTGVTAKAKLLTGGEPGLPPGWKRLGDKVYSPEAFNELFATRCVTFEVWSVLPNEGEATGDAWKRFRLAANLSWREATAFSNWSLAQLYAADLEPVQTKDGKSKLPAMPNINKALYQIGRERWSNLDSQSLGSVRQKVIAKYRQQRWDLRVTCKQSLATFRFPVPLPIPTKDATLSMDDNQPWISVRVSGQRFSLRLSRGPQWQRQINDFNAILAGEARQGEVIIREDKKGVMVGIVGNFPKKFGIREDKVLLVQTSKDRLWTVSLEGRDHTWNLNEDQIKQIIIGHKARVLRLFEDQKFERRIGLDVLATVRDRISQKYRNRLTDYCHKASAMLIGFAQRNKIGIIRYTEVAEKFCQDFPYFMLKTMVEQKASAVGISVEIVTVSDG